MTRIQKKIDIANSILEAIAEKYGDGGMFDWYRATPKSTKRSPDGTWYEYESLIVDILDKYEGRGK